MEISALQPRVQASQVPLDKLAANGSISEQEKVGEACRQFEALLLRQILQEARKTVIPSGGNAGANNATAGIYNDMVNNQMADSISRSGEFGLAKSLQSQLTHQILPAADAAKYHAALPATPISKKTKP